jgi:hypothetical protein
MEANDNLSLVDIINEKREESFSRYVDLAIEGILKDIKINPTKTIFMSKFIFWIKLTLKNFVRG